LWCTIGNPKSEAGQRDIPMAGYLFNTLREWKLTCPKNDLGLVFPNGAGNVERHSNLTCRVWYPLQQAAGLVTDNGKPRFNFHTLRHYAVSVWIEAGFTPKRVQKLVGHSSIQMTYDIYGHLFPSSEDDQAVFGRIERDIGLVA
jgi:integrase